MACDKTVQTELNLHCVPEAAAVQGPVGACTSLALRAVESGAQDSSAQIQVHMCAAGCSPAMHPAPPTNGNQAVLQMHSHQA